jgi:hypothetical protein
MCDMDKNDDSINNNYNNNNNNINNNDITNINTIIFSYNYRPFYIAYVPKNTNNVYNNDVNNNVTSNAESSSSYIIQQPLTYNTLDNANSFSCPYSPYSSSDINIEIILFILFLHLHFLLKIHQKFNHLLAFYLNQKLLLLILLIIYYFIMYFYFLLGIGRI